jgi:hypothetical protein
MCRCGPSDLLGLERYDQAIVPSALPDDATWNCPAARWGAEFSVAACYFVIGADKSICVHLGRDPSSKVDSLCGGSCLIRFELIGHRQNLYGETPPRRWVGATIARSTYRTCAALLSQATTRLVLIPNSSKVSAAPNHRQRQQTGPITAGTLIQIAHKVGSSKTRDVGGREAAAEAVRSTVCFGLTPVRHINIAKIQIPQGLAKRLWLWCWNYHRACEFDRSDNIARLG